MLCLTLRSRCVACRCYSSLVHPTDAADAPGGFHDRCDTFDETLVIATHTETSRVFGGFAGGSWAGTGWDSSADDSFIMELSPYPRRWESSGTVAFIMKDVYGWPEWGNDELRFGQRGPLGLGDTTNPNAYDARCIAGVVYGTQADQPCGTRPGTFGPTQMEVYYRCGEGSGNGPCPWDPPPPSPSPSSPPSPSFSFGNQNVLNTGEVLQRSLWTITTDRQCSESGAAADASHRHATEQLCKAACAIDATCIACSWVCDANQQVWLSVSMCTQIVSACGSALHYITRTSYVRPSEEQLRWQTTLQNWNIAGNWTT